MIQGASPGRFLALSQKETDPRTSSTSQRSVIRYERMLIPISVCILLLMSLSFSLTRLTTNAASSPPGVMHSSVHPSLSSSSTVTAKHSSSSENITVRGETGVIPLTLVDLISTIVVALIPALLGSMFILTSRRALRKREQQQWAGWVQLAQEQEQLGWPEEGEVELEGMGAQEKEQQEGHNEVQTDAFELLSQVSVINEHTHSRLSRLKCRLRSVPEPLPPG